jgi:integrase
MPKYKLNDSYIRNPKMPDGSPLPKDKRVEIYDDHYSVTGLALRVTKTGYKSFVFRYWFDGKAKRFTIGKYPVVSLAEARDEARELYKLVIKGKDPLAEKNNHKNPPEPVQETLFVQLAEDFMEIYFKELRPKTRKEYRRIIEVELIPALGKIPLKELDKKHFIKLLDKKAITDDSPTMANRIGTRLHTILEWGVSRGELQENPAAGLKKYEQGENRRDRIYSDDEIRKLWKAFDLEPEPGRSVLMMLLLCAQRSTETRFMHWDYVNDGVWTIPAELSKSKREHHVPLPDMALDILNSICPNQADRTGYVFESIPGEPLKSLKRAKDRVRDVSKVKDFTPHDLRRTATSKMAALKVDRTVLGKILNHKGMSGDNKVIGIYDRHDYMNEKLEALTAWNEKLQEILNAKSENKKSA